MKKVNALILGLVVLLAFGCGKDDEEIQKQDALNKVCSLSNNSTISQSNNIVYTYDASGQIIKADEFSTSWAGQTKLATYNNNGEIKKIKIIDKGTNALTVTQVFKYNTDTLITKITSYNKSLLDTTTTIGVTEFEYDNSKRLIKVLYYPINQPTVINHYKVISYGSNDYMREEDHYSNNITTIREFQFTTSKTPGGKLAYFNQPGVDLAGFIYNKIPTRLTFTSIDSSGSQQGIFNYTYTFNDFGYPIEQFQNGSQLVNTWTYNCQ